MSQWVLQYDGFDPQQERLREALCTLGNGYFATRGAAEEALADPTHYPGTYLAGGYNRLDTMVAGRIITNEDLVNFPNWLRLTFRCDNGDWLNLMAVEVLSYRQELHLKNGVLIRRFRFRDKEGRETTVQSRRLVHMGNPHLAAMETAITAENWSGRVFIKSELDGSVINGGVERYKQLNSKHLETLDKGAMGDDGIYLLVRTNQSRLEVAEAARTRLYAGGETLPVAAPAYEEKEIIGQEFALELERQKTVTVEKTVTLYTSRDRAISESSLAARCALARCGRFQDLLESHSRAWERLWRRCDVEVRARNNSQLALRVHIFHLLQTISMHTAELDVGVPARGLHGEAYRGHIFWDELFMFFFYTLRVPEVTRSLLLYRFRRLDAARREAREAGYQGAMYPWQSASDGSEETQIVHLNPNSGRWLDDHSHLQRHVNIAIVYNIWQYLKVSGDLDFLTNYGAEMMLEIARFWSSIAAYNHKTRRYEISNVMGPDEYHEKYPDSEKGGLKNNAYTNVMAVWVLERALEALDLLNEERRRELSEELGLKADEVKRWRDITRKMTVPFHGDGIISQFEGYDRLEELDWERYRKKYGSIGRLDRILEAEGDSPDRYKLSKQADVLMIFYLLPIPEVRRIFKQLGYDFDDGAFRRNIDYYMERTSHGSTLSRVVHAFVVAQIDPKRFWVFFTEALQSDIADIQGGTTQEGIHLGAMGGIDDLVLGCYAGIDTWGKTISFNPVLPGGMQKLHLRICYRARWFELDMVKGRLRLSVDKNGTQPVQVAVKGKTRSIRPGCARDFKL